MAEEKVTDLITLFAPVILLAVRFIAIPSERATHATDDSGHPKQEWAGRVQMSAQVAAREKDRQPDNNQKRKRLRHMGGLLAEHRHESEHR